ncbi:SH3 domain-containing protein, partial [Pseudanabaenaceae cyanobacterium LEGE 13415]|nr:SH3 domain-containing protein [Pseudanabaenaceae cyanobacterium LEGE 13415]
MKPPSKQPLWSCALRRSTILLTLVTCAFAYRPLPALSDARTIAQSDPDYTQEILNNTVCSFIVTQDVGGIVNIRQSPSTNAPVVAKLRRGDGVRATSRQGNWVSIAARSHDFGSSQTYS